jgi:aspartyl/asparaginyl-tRNA synthetase
MISAGSSNGFQASWAIPGGDEHHLSGLQDLLDAADLPRVFAFSPDVRIEASERRFSGKHLIEFVRLDLEVKEASREDLVALGEELFVRILTRAKAN